MFDPFADDPDPPVRSTTGPARPRRRSTPTRLDGSGLSFDHPTTPPAAHPAAAPPAASTATPPAGPHGRRRSPVLAALVAVSLAASGYAVARATDHNTTTVVRTASSDATTATLPKPTTVGTSNGTTEPIAAVAAALAPSVVQIETSQGLGSGFIYDSAGHVLTAAHVVTGAGDTVTVRLADGTAQTGRVVGADASTDVAVIKINLSGTKAKIANLAVGDALQVGQTAVAIGSPFGLEQTVTSGIVSAVDRAMQTTNGADRHDPDRRPDQPRQLRRAARRPPGSRHRDQRPDRERVGKQQRSRLRDPDRHREGRRRQDRRRASR